MFVYLYVDLFEDLKHSDFGAIVRWRLYQGEGVVDAKEGKEHYCGFDGFSAEKQLYVYIITGFETQRIWRL